MYFGTKDSILAPKSYFRSRFTITRVEVYCFWIRIRILLLMWRVSVSEWRNSSSNCVVSSSGLCFLASGGVFGCGWSYFVGEIHDLGAKILSFGPEINSCANEIDISALE